MSFLLFSFKFLFFKIKKFILNDNHLKQIMLKNNHLKDKDKDFIFFVNDQDMKSQAKQKKQL